MAKVKVFVHAPAADMDADGRARFYGTRFVVAANKLKNFVKEEVHLQSV